MSTGDYYNQNAAWFMADTLGLDMDALHRKFLANLPIGALILDAGCGSGRDSRAFLDQGYRVHAFDASAEVAELACKHLGQQVEVEYFEEFEANAVYDGIWACASLLHVREADLPVAFSRLWDALKPGGVLYASLKYGEGERIDAHGRHFTDANEFRLRTWVTGLRGLFKTDCWVTADQRADRSDTWLNALLYKASTPTKKLITGERKNPFLPQLCDAMATASEIDLAVAFVKVTGLRMLLPDLQAALAQRGEGDGHRPPARVRILTSDYLDITDPEALRLLSLLQAQGVEVRVFHSAASSFHLKAYIFARVDSQRLLHGTAFIGSSNISRQALTDGLEWNYRIVYPDDDGYLEARNRFEEIFRDPRTVELSDEWIAAYEQRRVSPIRGVEPGSDETEPPPTPTQIQVEALEALENTRREGYRRGLVVLATGLGKTWLAAFDAEQTDARRVLFVAHREEILAQAAETFARIRPRRRIGFFKGQTRDAANDVLCASVQTLSRAAHLERFPPGHFDYIVIDEFHHAAAPTYRRLLGHFEPRFLLGLTATPDRTDQSDILALCDENLVFMRDLFAGIEASLLAPFHYYGIWDQSVDYREIPWRSGRFDPEALSAKLATMARARHALREWRARAQQRTLAFCVSIKHAEFMAKRFRRDDVRAAAVYAGSELSRGSALAQLEDGRLQVIFSVDLFNEGVDLPAIDTVMMLRPTESKILFLQQLGRGLRKAPDKAKLVVLDFIGNHNAFLHKAQALGRAGSSYRELAAFARRAEEGRLELPPECFINYDLRLIEFLKSLDSDGIAKDYEALRDGLGRRPTLAEFYRAGASVVRMRREYGSWLELVTTFGDLEMSEREVAENHREFLRELEVTPMTKSFKMVLLEAFQELDGWRRAPDLNQLAARSREILERHRPLLTDLPESMRSGDEASDEAWVRYWRDNPINAWVGGNRHSDTRRWFRVAEQEVEPYFEPAFEVDQRESETLAALVQELIDFRLASYEARLSTHTVPGEDIDVPPSDPNDSELPYFPDLRMACGHFRSGRVDSDEYRRLRSEQRELNPARHFIARASGDSMDGGDQPIRDGDYLLLEHVQGDLTRHLGEVVAIERDAAGSGQQYVLRVPVLGPDGQLSLRASNPAYEDVELDQGMRMVARLCEVLDPLELAVGREFRREVIPALFGTEFNPGNWHSGHVVLNEKDAHVLLVTLNKQGKSADHRYLDHWIDERTFHWQTQNSTTPQNKRGRELIEHKQRGISLHLFVRDRKLSGGRAAPFIYHGKAHYVSHQGSGPMSVILKLGESADDDS